jgi:lysophospholipase L1-like esterase
MQSALSFPPSWRADRRVLTPALALLFASVANTGALAACEPQYPVRIQLFGDSIMEGVQSFTRGEIPTQPPAALLRAHFDRLYGNGVVVVSTRAVAGSTASDLADGSDDLNAPWPRSVDANIVVVNHGVNDSARRVDLGIYRAAIRKLSVAPARVIFQTPTMTLSHDVAPYAQVMRDVAAEAGVAVADAFAYTAGRRDLSALIPDATHPSRRLYSLIVANVLAPVVSRAVAELRCESPAAPVRSR